MQKITGVCRRLLEYAEDYWNMQKITGICRRLLGYAEDYWGMQITGVCRRLLECAAVYCILLGLSSWHACLPAETLVYSLEEP